MESLRVAIIADTHGFLDPRIAERIADCDVAVHAGDIGGADVLLALNARQEVVAVRGNNDTARTWTDSEHSLLEMLPREAAVSLPGGQLVVVHGDDGGTLAARHTRYRRHYDEARAVVYGHSHKLLIDQNESPWLLNPGAAGRTRTNGGPSCLMLKCDGDHWSVQGIRFEPRRYPSVRRRTRRRQRSDSGD